MKMPCSSRIALALLLTLFAFAPGARAAITGSSYAYSGGGGFSLIDISSGSTLLIGPDVDDATSPVTDIGFDFFFDGVRYTQFSVNSNGLCRLGPIAIDGSFDNSSDFASTVNAPKIAPYFDDLFVGTNGKVHAKVTGTAPNRRLVIEWRNLQVPLVGPGQPGAATFQLWINETTGVLNFVYGAGMLMNSANGGYTIGIQSGAANNLASATYSPSAISYGTANNTQSSAIPAGALLRFAPPIPAAPGFVNFQNVRSGAMTVRWPDNVPGAVGYVLYRSTDGGATYTFETTRPPGAGTTSYTANLLSPSTTYTWRVHAFSEGGLSAAQTGTQATTAPLNIASQLVTGVWSDPAVWVGNLVPTSGDNVTVSAAANLTLDVDGYAANLDVNGTLTYEAATARRLSVLGNLGLSINGTLRTDASANVAQTGHVLAVAGSIGYQGRIDLYATGPFNHQQAVTLELIGNADATFAGNANFTTDLYELVLNKSAGRTVNFVFPSVAFGSLSIKGSTTSTDGFLTLKGGILRIQGPLAKTTLLFKTPQYVIPAGAGLWLDNPNFTVLGSPSGTTTVNDGLLRISNGNFFVGTGAADGLGGDNHGVFQIEGGNFNVTRFDPQGPVSYTQSGGTVTVAAVGNSRPDYGSFELYHRDATFTMTGGQIVLAGVNTSGTPVDYRVRALNLNVSPSGPQLVAGPVGSPAMSFLVHGATPSLRVNAGMEVRADGVLAILGGAVMNQGNIREGAAPGSRFDFAAATPMTYSGSGTFGTAVAPFGGDGIAIANPTTVTLSAPIRTNSVTFFGGGFVNSGQLTLGNGGTSATLVRFSSAFGVAAISGFDVSPVHNQGTGGQSLLYLGEPAQRVVGHELNPTRSVASLIVENPSGIVLASGNLTVTNSLALTSGRIVTGGNVLIAGLSTITRTDGYVDGNLRRTLPGTNVGYIYDVGSSSSYAPVVITSFVPGGNRDVTVRTTGVQHPSYPPGFPGYRQGLQRFWTVTAPDPFVSRLTFVYPQEEVFGDESFYRLLRFANGAIQGNTGSSLDPETNVSSVTVNQPGGDWILADDNDGDGMTDAYEAAHGFNSSSAADAAADADGDGLSNLAEQFAGTNPRSANSRLRVTSIAFNGSGKPVITFDAVAGKKYRLEVKSDLATAGNWFSASLPDVTAASTGPAQFTDVLLTTETKLFYRVVLLSP